MKKNYRNFIRSEAGDSTVDWVVLTAAIVGLVLIILQTVRPPAEVPSVTETPASD
jgi:hypothetical protein